MDQTLKELLCQKYNLDKFSNVKLLNSGENDTFLVDYNRGKMIVRKYRPKRYDGQQIQAEVDWLKALNDELAVPIVIPNKHSDDVTTVFYKETDHHFVAFDFIKGEEIEEPGELEFERLGRLMNTLHEKGNHILKSAEKKWTGLNRPTFDEDLALQQSVQHLCDAKFLSNQQKELCIKTAEQIHKLLPELGGIQFIHGDMHFGNIINDNDKWHILDFDESGFGYKEYDLAVPRMFLLATNQLDGKWSKFKDGYGVMPSESAIRAGTALRIFYMTGKLPLRLDIEHIRENPSRYVERYLELINMELSGNVPI